MKPLEATPHIQKLNKIINGSQQIIDAIDADKEINTRKAIRAAMLNNKLLAEEMKTIIGELVNFGNGANFMDELFGGLKKS